MRPLPVVGAVATAKCVALAAAITCKKEPGTWCGGPHDAPPLEEVTTNKLEVAAPGRAQRDEKATCGRRDADGVVDRSPGASAWITEPVPDAPGVERAEEDCLLRPTPGAEIAVDSNVDVLASLRDELR